MILSALAISLAVEYSAHAEEKLSTRRVSKEEVKKLIDRPKQRFLDIEHNAEVAVGPLKGRSLVVIYHRANADIKVITVFHARKLEKLISSKTKRGAWSEAV